MYCAGWAGVRETLKTAGQTFLTLVAYRALLPLEYSTDQPLPLLTVGETLAHADNLDGGPGLPGRGLDAAFVERPGRGPMRQTGKLGEHRAQRLTPLQRLGL